ncbi:MAG: dienelactone hydrolase family protein [Parvularculaceae bacterium]
MRRPRLLLIAAALVGLVIYGAFNIERIALDMRAAGFEKRTLAEQEALIEPFIHIFPPAEGSPPYPVVVQFHGCAGYQQSFMKLWADAANAEGFMAVAIDSTGPRGMDREKSLALVCTGKTLIGEERAADVTAALDLVKKRADVNKDKIVIAGWSHGAWTVMDYLALGAMGKRSPALSEKTPPAGLAGIALFYPYCGLGAWSRLHDWNERAPAIAFVAGADTIVNSKECVSLITKMKRRGEDIDFVYYPDADHVFDDSTLIGGPYEHMYNKTDANDATARYRAFLAGVRAQ